MFRSKKNEPRSVSFKKGSLRHSIYESVLKDFEKSGKPVLECVKVPPGRNKNDWIMVHVKLFFNKINELYAVVSSDCSETKTCKRMTIQQCDAISWIDHDTKVKKNLSAYEYVMAAFDLAENKMKDEVFFPECTDCTVPAEEFSAICRKLFTEYFRILGHIYRHHITQFDEQGKRDFDKHYEHFLAFVREHGMVGHREFSCMKDITQEILRRVNNDSTPSVAMA